MAGAQNRCLVKTGTVLGAKNGPSKLLMRREKEIIIRTSSQGGGGVLQISSVGDDRRIFWGFEIFDSGIFLGGKFGKYFFGWLDLSRDFLGIQNNLKILGSARVSWQHRSTNKVQPNLFCSCFNIILTLVSHYIASVS